MALVTPCSSRAEYSEDEEHTETQNRTIRNYTAVLKEALQDSIAVNSFFHMDPSNPNKETTALHEAARRGDVDAICDLVIRGAEVNGREYTDNDELYADTALHCAARNAHSGAVQVLLNAGAEPVLYGSDSDTPFETVWNQQYCRLEDENRMDDRRIATIIAFLDHRNGRDNAKVAMLMKHAVRAADVQMIQLLLDRDISQEGLLKTAAYCHHEPDILEFLVDRGACDMDGQALYEAARWNKPALVSFLLHHAESMSVMESCGALHIAAKQGHLDILQMLFGHGLSPDAQDCADLTPLIQVCMAHQPSSAAIQLLLDNGADVNMTGGRYGDTPLHAAASYCREEILSLLLKSGADVHGRNKAGETPLIKLAAAMVGPDVPVASLKTTTTQPAVMKLVDERLVDARLDGLDMLLQAGSDVNAVTDAGNTALLTLVMSRRSEQEGYVIQAIKLLLENGADPEIRNSNGKLAADFVGKGGTCRRVD